MPLDQSAPAIGVLIRKLSASSEFRVPCYPSDGYLPEGSEWNMGPDDLEISHAKDALIAIGRDAVPALCEALNHVNSYEVRDGRDTYIQYDTARAAAEALGTIRDERGVPPLCDLLHHRDSQLAETAAVALGRIANDKALEALCSVLQRRDGVGSASAVALGRIGDRRAIPFLVKALNVGQPYYNLRPARTYLDDNWRSTFTNVLAGLVGETTLTPPSPVPTVRAAVATLLGEQKSVQSGPDLFRLAMSDSDNSVRSAAAIALFVICQEDTLRVEGLAALALSEAVKHPTKTVALAAVRILKESVQANAVPLLSTALDHEDEEVAKEAAAALGHHGPDSVEPLCHALKRLDSKVAVTAAVSLGQIGYIAAISALCDALTGRNDVAAAAANALGLLNDARAVLALGKSLKRGYPVNAAAAEALLKIGEPSIGTFCAALAGESDEARLAATALLRLGNMVVLPLCQTLKGCNRSALLQAISILSEIGDLRAVPYLCEALEHSDGAVVSNTAAALGKLGDLSAIPPMVRAAERFNARCSTDVIEALACFGRAAVRPLCVLLKHQDQITRARAALHLQRIAKAAPEQHGDWDEAIPALRIGLSQSSWLSRERQIYKQAIETIEAIHSSKSFDGVLRLNRFLLAAIAALGLYALLMR